MFESHGYTVDRETFLLDYDAIEKQAVEVKPLILLAGFSAYSRNINYARMREIADRVGAVLMVDMAHFAGLVAGKVLQGDFNPIPHAHVVTTTTHKTLRGPRGGLVLTTPEFSEHVDRGCPLVLGGPLPHVMAAKAVAFTEALRPEFATYAQQIVANARALAEAFVREGLNVAHGRDRQPPAGPRRRLDPRHHRPAGRGRGPAVRDHPQSQPDPLRPQRPVVHQRPAVRRRRGHHAGHGQARDGRDRRGRRPGAQERQAGDRRSRAHSTRRNTPSTRPSATRPTARVKNLLDSYPVYPEIDLPFLQESLGIAQP